MLWTGYVKLHFYWFSIIIIGDNYWWHIDDFLLISDICIKPISDIAYQFNPNQYPIFCPSRYPILYQLAPCQWGSHPDSQPHKLINCSMMKYAVMNLSSSCYGGSMEEIGNRQIDLSDYSMMMNFQGSLRIMICSKVLLGNRSMISISILHNRCVR